MKGVYLCAYKSKKFNYDIDYNDILDLPNINLKCSCLDIDLSNYDFILGSPPCNYWSRANWRRNVSDYALNTKCLLPLLLEKCYKSGKPFILENVRNDNLFLQEGIYSLCDNLGILTYFVGRHTYFTNIMFNPSNILQVFDNIHNVSSSMRQGGINVYNVFNIWLEVVLN